MKRMIVLLVVCSLNAAAQSPQVFAVGLQRPIRLLFTPQGSLLVSEGGNATPNTGRVSILDSGGNRRSLLEGLPSGAAHFTTPFGPTSMALDGSTLYLLLGEGDVMAGTPPNYGINPRGPSSPIFSSVLKVRFSQEIDLIPNGFTLTPDDHWRLFDGFDVELKNQAGDRANVHVLTKFRPLVRDPFGIEAVRRSDPYGAVLSPAGKSLYVVDAGSETVVKVDTETGHSQLVVRFPSYVRRLADGSTLRVDNVPSGICWSGEELLVSFLSGAPYPPGEASIRSVNRATGEVTPFISGLTAAIDVLCSKGPSGGRYYTLEWTQDFSRAAVPSGRLRVYDGSGSRTLASQLTLPTGMAQDPVSGDIFIARYFGGQILRVRVE